VKLRRSNAAAPEAPDVGRGSRDGTPDTALDAVAAILRVLGEALHDADAAAQLDAWARHILVLETPPGATGPIAEPSRDWVGLRRHVVSHVRDDRAAVTRSIGDLQDAVWLVVDGLSQAIVGDIAADADAVSQLERLRAAAGGSAAELKATALETVPRLSEILDERSARQLRLARELGERVEVLRVELDDTRREVEIDPLTKLGNRSVLQRELPRAVQVRTLVDEPACLAVVDLDHFKQINDLHGHQTGDSALEAFASALVRCFPRRRDVVTRFGGDEFAVILRDATVEEGCRLAERFLEAVRQLEVSGPHEGLQLSASVGVAEALPGEPADDWFARADRALYEAKAGGRDRVAIATDGSAGASRLAA
jgi:diguanylate cyclase (GGDEF)-like protein